MRWRSFCAQSFAHLYSSISATWSVARHTEICPRPIHSPDWRARVLRCCTASREGTPPLSSSIARGRPSATTRAHSATTRHSHKKPYARIPQEHVFMFGRLCSARCTQHIYIFTRMTSMHVRLRRVFSVPNVPEARRNSISSSCSSEKERER